MTERLQLSCIGEGNGNPLQCSCLENPRDGGAWWANLVSSEDLRSLPPILIQSIDKTVIQACIFWVEYWVALKITFMKCVVFKDIKIMSTMIATNIVVTRCENE